MHLPIRVAQGAAVREIIVVAHCSLEKVFLWVDVCSIPQDQYREHNLTLWPSDCWVIPLKLWLPLQSLHCSVLGQYDPHPRSTWQLASYSLRLYHSTSLLQTSSSSSRRPRSTATVQWICPRTFVPAALVRETGQGAGRFSAPVSGFPRFFPFRVCVRESEAGVGRSCWRDFLDLTWRSYSCAKPATGPSSRSHSIWCALSILFFGNFSFCERRHVGHTRCDRERLRTPFSAFSISICGKRCDIRQTRMSSRWSGSSVTRSRCFPGPSSTWSWTRTTRDRADSPALWAAARDSERTHTGIGSSPQRTQHAVWRGGGRSGERPGGTERWHPIVWSVPGADITWGR